MREPEDRLVAGRYRLRARLGSGGMGTVWRATDEFLEREVAIKEVTPLGALDESSPTFQRTLREARASARLRHPGIVTVHDVVLEDGRPWIVMEMIDGRSLADVVEQDGPLPEHRVTDLARQLLAALAATHSDGILHRDVKPGNVLLDGDRVVLADFGIAAIEGGTALTATNQLIGSPQYLAPERINGQPAGPPSDLWALGVTLYFALTGQSPFQREDTQAVLAAVLTQEPPAVPGALAPLVAGLLRKNPVERLDVVQAAELLTGTREITEPTRPVARPEPDEPTQVTSRPARGRRQLVVSLALVVALGAAALVWVFWPQNTAGADLSGSATFDRMTERGKVIIGIREDQPGLGYRSPTDNTLGGFDIEIAKLVAARLGFGPDKVTFTPVSPGTRESDLTTGAVDMVLGTYAMTADSAGPYLAGGLGLLERREISAVRTVCAATGTTIARQLRNGDLINDADVELRPTWNDCVDDLVRGTVDSVYAEEVLVAGYSSANPDQLKGYSASTTTTQYGIGLAHGDTQLRDKINDILRQLLSDGTWRATYDRTLGRSDIKPTMPKVRS
jgi:ABC-type amino acid transport substrate-binding protein